MKNNQLQASVIVLNYFGENLIEKCLDSIYKQNFPKDKFEIIVVDNHSQDKSRKILLGYQKNHPDLKLIFNNQNYGFGEGNNIGVKEATGKYVLLLNNDCVVDENWIGELVKTADSEKNIFSVNAKILLYPSIHTVQLKTNNPIFLTKSNLLKTVGREKIQINIIKKNEKFFAEVPFDKFSDTAVEISDGQITQKINIVKNLKTSYHKIQNAGITVFQNGYGRDNGSLIKESLQDYEIDSSQYRTVKEVYAACGGSVLYKRDLFNKLKGFDKNFFLYYEDVDLSERARLRGYRIVFAPKSIAYHYHSLSAKEWSPLFIYHSEKGRLLHTFFNFPKRIFLKEFFRFSAFSVVRQFLFFKNKSDSVKNFQYFKIFIYFLTHMPKLILNRIIRNKDLPNGAIEKNYQRIFSGYWYFN